MGIPGKNLLMVGRKTLLERTLELATQSGLFDKVVVSTESAVVAQKVAESLSEPIALDLSLSTMKRIFKLNEIIEIHNRSIAVSGDYIKSIDVVQEYLDYSKLTSGFFTLLQPTSPFRNSKELTMLLKQQEQHPQDSIFSAKIVESPHPEKCFPLQQNPKGEYILEKLPAGISVPRQYLPRLACPDGAYYSVPIDHLISKKQFVLANSLIMLREGFWTVNIDTEFDYMFANYLVSTGKMI